jgi:hypothetical protein
MSKLLSTIYVHCTEVGRDPLIHFQKMFLKKRVTIDQNQSVTQILSLDYDIWLKNVKKGQKMLKKAKNYA